MKSNPKVSIVIPVYNGSNYLREAIESALAQTYKNVEVIVVNDGSNDNGETEKIAKSYGNRIRYFAKENGGVSTALNFGIRKMDGEWFSWLSHDDYYYPEKIEKQIGLITDNQNIKVTFCNTGWMDAEGRTILDDNPECASILRGGAAAWQIWICACSLLIHKSCFDVVGMINESNYTTQDTELILQLLHNYDVYHLQEVLVNKRSHEERGIHVHRQLNQQEHNALMHRLLDQYGISFFFPKVAYGSSDSRSLAAAYEKLGDWNLDPQDPNFSIRCYNASFQAWRSLRNTASYKALLRGAALWQWRLIEKRLSRVVRATRLIRHNLNGKPITLWPRLLKDFWTEYQQRL